MTPERMPSWGIEAARLPLEGRITLHKGDLIYMAMGGGWLGIYRRPRRRWWQSRRWWRKQPVVLVGKSEFQPRTTPPWASWAGY